MLNMYIKAFAEGTLKGNTAAGQRRLVNNMRANGASEQEITRAVSNLRSNPGVRVGVVPERQRGRQSTSNR